MSLHELKTWPEYFERVRSKAKRAEFRRDDRPFRDGDTLLLREWDPATGEYTGRRIWAYVTDVARGGVIPEGFAMLSISLLTYRDERVYKPTRRRRVPVVPVSEAIKAPRLLGVRYCKKGRYFIAQLSRGLDTMYLGSFGDPIEAARVRDAKVRELGLRTPLNFPDAEVAS